VKISTQKSVKNLVSRYSEGSKKFYYFFDFCAQLPALLIENYWIPAKEMRGPMLRSGPQF
jgi:hypothetical protein